MFGEVSMAMEQRSDKGGDSTRPPSILYNDKDKLAVFYKAYMNLGEFQKQFQWWS